MQIGPGDVLRGQQQEEEEGQVGRCVTDELDEGLLDKVSQSALRSQQVDLWRRGGRRKREKQELKQGTGEGREGKEKKRTKQIGDEDTERTRE